MPEDLRAAVERFASELAIRYPLATLEDPTRQHQALDFAEQEVPGLREFVDAAAGQVAQAGGVVAKQVFTGSDEFVAVLSSCLGQVSVGGNGFPPRLVFDVTPRTGQDGTVLTGSRGHDEFTLHTDSATHEVPHAYFTLACVTAPSEVGGESLLIRADDIVAALSASHTVALARLADPVYPFLADFGDQGTKLRLGAVLADGTVRYGGKEIRAGAHQHPLDADHFTALEQFEAMFSGLTRTFCLRPGDVMLIDNGKVLHGRRSFEPTARRLLKRCKIHRVEGSRVEEARRTV